MILPPLTPATLGLYTSLIKEGIAMGIWTYNTLKPLFSGNPQALRAIEELCNSADAKDDETLRILRGEH